MSAETRVKATSTLTGFKPGIPIRPCGKRCVAPVGISMISSTAPMRKSASTAMPRISDIDTKNASISPCASIVPQAAPKPISPIATRIQ